MSQSKTFSKSFVAVAALRALWHLISILTVTLWGMLAWPLPFPGLLVGGGMFIFAVIMWAMFLSPRPVLRTDRFAQGLIELVLIACAVGAALSLGVHWALAAAFGLAGAAFGFIVGSKVGK